MLGLWDRHLVVFVGLLLLVGTSLADKEFWWMGQEGTFGQGSQVRNCGNLIFVKQYVDMMHYYSGTSSPTAGVWSITQLPRRAR